MKIFLVTSLALGLVVLFCKTQVYMGWSSIVNDHNRLVLWVIVIDWTDQKWNVSVIVFDYIGSLIVMDDYFRDTWKSSPYITVRWTAVLVAGFPPLSPFVMVVFQGMPFARLRALNPDSPAASTAFVANFRCFSYAAFLLTARSKVVRRSIKNKSFSLKWVKMKLRQQKR